MPTTIPLIIMDNIGFPIDAIDLDLGYRHRQCIHQLNHLIL